MNKVHKYTHTHTHTHTHTQRDLALLNNPTSSNYLPYDNTDKIFRHIRRFLPIHPHRALATLRNSTSSSREGHASPTNKKKKKATANLSLGAISTSHTHIHAQALELPFNAALKGPPPTRRYTAEDMATSSNWIVRRVWALPPGVFRVGIVMESSFLPPVFDCLSQTTKERERER